MAVLVAIDTLHCTMVQSPHKQMTSRNYKTGLHKLCTRKMVLFPILWTKHQYIWQYRNTFKKAHMKLHFIKIKSKFHCSKYNTVINTKSKKLRALDLASQNMVNIGSGNSLVPVQHKPLPEPRLIYCQLDPEEEKIAEILDQNWRWPFCIHHKMHLTVEWKW